LRATITRDGIIEGGFTRQETVEMARLLNSGSLPGRVNPDPVRESSFGPTLGEENRRMGLRAAYIGLIAVAVFMLVYYLLAGSIADVALLLNIVLILGVMSLIDAVFTLPGIAGIILTIGIAVDANVLIFERLREEQERGQSVRMAMQNAYQRAFTAIFDANVTTLVTCLILGWVGTEEVKGFAITLGLGIVFSMFTALVITRWVFQLLLDWKVITKPIGMLRIIRTPKINWMGKRKAFWVVSAVLLIAGVLAIVGQGGNLLGIEFSSGTRALVRLRPDALLTDPATGEKELPNDGLVRRQFKGAAEKLEGELGGTVGELTGARVEKRIDPFRVQSFLEDYDTDEDGKVTGEEWAGQGMDPLYFEKLTARLDADKDGSLSGEELGGLPSREYQVSTTETLVSRVRTVIGEAFGKALDVRPGVDFEVLTGSDEDVQARALQQRVGVTLTSSGAVPVDDRVVDAADRQGLEEVVNFKGGMLAVVRGVSPAITAQDFTQRVRDIRDYADHSGLKGNYFNVIGLEEDPNTPDAYSAFLVLDRPADDRKIETAEGFSEYSSRVMQSVTEALKRQESLPVLNFDEAIAGEAARKAIIAIVFSWLAIVLYLWLRFGSLQWGIAAVICLVHDVLIVLGLVAISGYIYNSFGEVLGIQSFKVDLAMIAALLTVIGYSVNDTIVVFDRIRENRGKMTTITPSVLNSSVNQTLARTLLTSTTTLIVVVVMYAFGGAGIRAFSFALLMGVLFGTYSSIAIASPLLMGFKRAVTAKAVAPAQEQSDQPGSA
jgi:SecD/SecF fusion protein